MLRDPLLPAGLVALVLAQLVFADKAKDFTALYNQHGQTPCDLQTVLLNSPCSNLVTSQLASFSFHHRRRLVRYPTGLFRGDRRGNDELLQRDDISIDENNDDDPNPPPTNNCTCNNVFFNIHGACLTSQSHSNWLKSSKSWERSCSSQSTNFTIYTPQRQDIDNQDNTIPPWAYNTPIPEDGTFNVVDALSAADGVQPEPSHWSKLQIILPIAVGVGVALICGILLWVYNRRRNRRRRISNPSGVRKPPINRSRSYDKYDTLNFRSLRRALLPWSGNQVMETKPDLTWTIEPTPRQNSLLTSSSRSHRGHLRLSSSPTRPSGRPHPDGDTSARGPFPGSSAIKEFLGYLNPWKTKPIEVRRLRHSQIPPGTAFDLDAPGDRSTKTDSTLNNWRVAGFRESGLSLPIRTPNTAVWPGVSSPLAAQSTSRLQETIHEDEEGSEDEEDPLVLNQRMNAREYQASRTPSPSRPPLVIPRSAVSENSVLLISQGGRNFTIESGETGLDTPTRNIDVIPPSPLTHTAPPEAGIRTPSPLPPPPSRTQHRLQRSRSRSVPRTPPAPNYPAPLPPISPPRSPRRARGGGKLSLSSDEEDGRRPSDESIDSRIHQYQQHQQARERERQQNQQHQRQQSSNQPTQPSNLHFSSDDLLLSDLDGDLEALDASPSYELTEFGFSSPPYQVAQASSSTRGRPLPVAPRVPVDPYQQPHPPIGSIGVEPLISPPFRNQDAHNPQGESLLLSPAYTEVENTSNSSGLPYSSSLASRSVGRTVRSQPSTFDSSLRIKPPDSAVERVDPQMFFPGAVRAVGYNGRAEGRGVFQGSGG